MVDRLFLCRSSSGPVDGLNFISIRYTPALRIMESSRSRELARSANAMIDSQLDVPNFQISTYPCASFLVEDIFSRVASPVDSSRTARTKPTLIKPGDKL